MIKKIFYYLNYTLASKMKIEEGIPAFAGMTKGHSTFNFFKIIRNGFFTSFIKTKRFYKINLIYKLLLLIFIFSYNSYSADDFYLSISPGYGINPGGNPLLQGANITKQSTPSQIYLQDNENYNIIYGSLFGGYSVNVNLGYKLYENVEVQMNFNYLFGKEITADSIESNNDYDSKLQQTIYTQSYLAHISYLGTGISFEPAIKISYDFKTIKAYVTFGFIASIPEITYTSQNSYLEINSKSSITNHISYNENFTIKYQGNIGYGFLGSIGAEYNLSDNVDLIGEINLRNVYYNPSQRIVNYTYDEIGRDGYYTKASGSKTYDLVDKVSLNYTNNQTPDEQKTELRKFDNMRGSSFTLDLNSNNQNLNSHTFSGMNESFNISLLSFNIGFKFKF